VLEGCCAISSGFFDATRYAIVEPDATLRSAQRDTLGPSFAAKLTHDIASISGPALFLCNELLDALPVHRVRWDGSAWHELWVSKDASSAGGFAFVTGPLSDSALQEELASRGPELPPNWTTEVCPAVASWLDDVASLPFTGTVLIFDYGFTSIEHFAPERTEGTLRRYLNHRMDDRVLEDLGDADLTAHVDFTRVSDLAAIRGFCAGEFIEQGRFLTKLFIKAFQRHGGAPDAATQRQFHALTHPGHMGRSFHALVLRKP
jgi:SAM-dependent MidA family methyltransferase